MVKKEGCKLNLGATPFIGNELVQFPEFKIVPISLYNKAAVSCRPTSEGDGYLNYDKKRLYMSHTSTIFTEIDGSVGPTFINGWVLLED